jgi:hypothetical protein
LLSKIAKISIAVVVVFLLVSGTIFYTVRENTKNNSANDNNASGSYHALAKSKAGDTVYFGTYEQDNNTKDGKEKIAWRVLAVEKSKVLLFSEKILDSKPYDTVDEATVTWEKSTLRGWLNNSFLNEAFAAKEKKAVIITDVDNSRYDSSLGYYSPEGNNTKDEVFLLSLAQTEKYFKTNTAREAQGTKSAKSKGLDLAPVKDKNTASSYWWLRSPGYFPGCAFSVDFYGVVNDYSISGVHVGVRPAVWVNVG